MDPSFYRARSDVAATLAKSQMYYTLALLGCCEQRLIDKMPYLAAITNIDKLEVMYHPLIMELHKENLESLVCLVCHELFHLIQLESFADMEKLIDLTPIRDVYVHKRTLAKDPHNKAHWQMSIDRIDRGKAKSVKKLKRQIANIGMDTAANANILKIFKGSERIINSFLIRNKKELGITEPNEKIGMITPTKLSNTIGEHLPDDQEWTIYAKKYTDWYAKKLNESLDPDNPPPIIITLNGEGDDPEEWMTGHDSHEFGESSGEFQKEAEARARIRDALEKAKAEARILANQAGNKPADAAFFGDGSISLSKRIQKAIELIKVRFNKLYSPHSSEEYRFSRDNRIYPNEDLPGYWEVPTPSKSVVLVIDTSGSMWQADWLNQMLAVGRFYNRKGWLKKLYCCDTALHEVGFDSSFKSVQVKGGGGTIFTEKHVSRILDDLKMKKGVDIIYCTDECLDLRSAKADTRCKLHVVNVPQLLKE